MNRIKEAKEGRRSRGIHMTTIVEERKDEHSVEMEKGPTVSTPGKTGEGLKKIETTKGSVL